MCAFSLLQQFFHTALLTPLGVQLHLDAIDIAGRCLQPPRQLQRLLAGAVLTGGQCLARTLQRGLCGPRQRLLHLHPVRVQRRRRLEQFARAAAVRRAQPPLLQRLATGIQQFLDATFRPQPIRQRLPEYRQHDAQQQHADADGPPGAGAVPATRHPPAPIQPQLVAECFQSLLAALAPVLHAPSLPSPVFGHRLHPARPRVCPAGWTAARSR